ncbi:predicted protein [Naegleria gruberi]|uniref:Predicted protein n=1 Tax=Naegleria gruberi TaxID=5762 RepID=D2VVZ3_NAEGR|nr:uncharacterized protein NAEGRDRAFT_76813 [Naegleria gruberi]XP_002671731.1 uncharacterized protein NAEGRDRAFT_73192 [Naegleria gruberi]EFC35531.1 predicted protein [Naegleria gruberi]EFC38987.1 predicted protein [Naegleria gruberi]|eukprot:XP_002668275.1 predicted protein [Naegleria gruberi strain NEG-M]
MKSVKVYDDEESPTTVYHNPVEDIVMRLPDEFGKFVEKYEYCEELSRFAFISLLIGFLSGRNGRKLDYFNDTVRVGSKDKKEIDEMPLCCLFAIIQYSEPTELIIYTPNYFPNSKRFIFCNFESDLFWEFKSCGSEPFMEIRDLYEMFPYKRNTDLSKYRNGDGAIYFSKNWKELTIRVLYWERYFDE